MERREAVGNINKTLTPEQEAQKLDADIKAAESTGDIGTIVKLIAKASGLTTSDYVKKTIGNAMFIYYSYVNHFHCYPRTLDELVDGILYIDALNYIKKQETP